ncbi:tetratricopeptide repeat protein [Pleurocapsa sp. FMAR1]|uniref:tetratricopeptide repeat protein n=1 Tax=Pleurocapsa sp. FMAR1 TaxID=3040204 RepID=UPI0029C80CFC|nr:tetratricopeptide repeat protein [Pleurocapsa sp. FMAR1]
MSLKITAKILLTLTSMEIVLLFSALTPVAKTQNIYSPDSISAESVKSATELSQSGKAKLKQENYRGAIADFSQAIQLDPNNADFYYERGSILGELGDKEGAIRDFDDAILRNPHYARAYLKRGGMSIDLGLNQRVTDSRGVYFRTVDYRVRNSRAILDLRTARDLFAQQGDREGYQTANSLIQHFAGSLEPEKNQKF